MSKMVLTLACAGVLLLASAELRAARARSYAGGQARGARGQACA